MLWLNVWLVLQLEYHSGEELLNQNQVRNKNIKNNLKKATQITHAGRIKFTAKTISFQGIHLTLNIFRMFLKF